MTVKGFCQVDASCKDLGHSLAFRRAFHGDGLEVPVDSCGITSNTGIWSPERIELSRPAVVLDITTDERSGSSSRGMGSRALLR